MDGGQLTQLIAARLIAAALYFVVSITSVLGAGIAAAPAGAIATGPASIGAALFHQAPSVGRGEQRAAPGPTTARDQLVEEWREPVTGQLLAVARPFVTWPTPTEAVSEPVAHRESTAPSRVVPGNPSRAPPA
ncbi:hypothetical protein GCM10027290_25760 [Micromonospora sonneratiae]|uniref:Uncharacterized protein n=1 Tax=Micromonospora sonneratiae TaxID=1184706 RepID=A0ABW3YKZ8_9ACTN